MPTTGNTDQVTVRFLRPIRRLTQLTAGLTLYGFSMALMVVSGLGLTPWDVFHQGVSRATGVSFGTVVIITGVPILLLWIPLRQRPGVGTIANLVVIGLVVDGALAVLPSGGSLPVRVTYLVAGILLNGVATGLYIGTRLGPGPRDGLMTGIVGRFPRLSIRLVRTTIEVAVLAVGFLLGGTVGVGTIAYALAIGPLAQVFIPRFTLREPGQATLAATA
ncbi:YczE/YyaS/YitT family protein [Krasilnikovia sp. MM14-A1259]|uniref:membrane protein YczE n=1 Tax=Krasilnikovia sp. MM14-A1259 TaxID=3373539 RepID=UPI0037F2C91A